MGLILLLFPLAGLMALGGRAISMPASSSSGAQARPADHVVEDDHVMDHDEDPDSPTDGHGSSHSDMPVEDEPPEDEGETESEGHSGDDMGMDDEEPVDAPEEHEGHDTDMGSGEGSGDIEGHGDHDETHDGTTDSGDHSGHEMSDPATITPPLSSATQSEINAYVAAVRAQGETHAHGDDTSMMNEHMAAMDLVARDEATHVAVRSGDWFDPDTWHNGEVPGDDAKVLIPEGISVDYGELADERLFSVRIDGELQFATDEDSQMIFDTMVVSMTGRLEVGRVDAPIQEGFSVDLIVANNGPIDVEWDPMLLSRGIISHGEASIHGAAKDSHEKVIDDPMAGDTTLTFDEAPEGWEIGDTIVIAGTRYDGHKWDNSIKDVRHYDSEDEVRVITDIQDGTITLDSALVHDHDAPRDDLSTSVANYSRNVSVRTEDPDDAEVHERGHVMFMHSDEVDVRFAEFYELGRTDKSEDSFQASDFETIESDSNVQGRYSLHLHRTGVEEGSEPSQIIGNAVWGSPGWGYVHHDSNAHLENNASFDTFGAGFVAETGNETGAWVDNIAIFAEGESWGAVKNVTEISETVFDTAKGGHGFWFQGRMIETSDNVAASVNVGYVYFHRDGDDREIDSSAANFEFSDALFNDTSIKNGHIPILGFTGNETFAAHEGLHVVKASPDQEHDVWSQIDDFTAWSVQNGLWLEYTAHYLLTDIDLIAKEDTPYSPSGVGFGFGKNVSEMVIMDSTVSGFNNGANLQKVLVGQEGHTAEDQGYTFINTQFTDITSVDLNYFDEGIDFAGSLSDLTSYEPDLVLDPLVTEDSEVIISGVKYDGLGQSEFAGGTDEILMDRQDLLSELNDNGFWTTTSGDTYFLTDVYFTDRATGDVYFETHAVDVVDNIASKLGKSSWEYHSVENNGVQDITVSEGETWAGDIQLDVAVLASGHSGHHEASSSVHSMTPGEVWEALTEGQGTHDETMPMEDDAEHDDENSLEFA